MSINTCWFCCHPGVNHLHPGLVIDLNLEKVCEAHVDFLIYYSNPENGIFHQPVTIRQVKDFIKRLETEPDKYEKIKEKA